MTIETHFAFNEKLGQPPMEAVVWRFMAPWVFKDLLDQRGLWFSRLDLMEDEFEGTVPKANLRPSYDALSEAVGPFLAHAHGFRELAGAAFKRRVDRERPFNLINCWYLSDQPSEFMWARYSSERGSVAIRSVVGQVAEALHHPGAATAVFAWPITYIDHDREEVNMKHFIGSFFVKGRIYEEEREIRFLLHLDEVVEKGLHVALRLEPLIDRILVQTKGDASAVDEVQRLVERAGLDRPVEAGA
jgi:hypothetical protein